MRLGQPLIFGPMNRLSIHSTAIVNNALFNLSSGTITVEKYAFLGHNVQLLAGRHDTTARDRERQLSIPERGCDIVVKHGAWIASGAIIIGPCEIGENAVVAAGSVVTRNVPPAQIVAGNPAKIIMAV